MTTVEEKKDYKKALKKLSEPFQLLINENQQKRLSGVIQILQSYAVDKTYVLKRLIRGCGASTNASRIGFFTALIAILKSVPTQDVPLESIFEHTEHELNDDHNEAKTGKLLVCNAILRAGRLADISHKNLQKFIKLILATARNCSYLESMGYTILVDVIRELPTKSFKDTAWPQLLQPELQKPLQRLTLTKFHCLLVANAQYTGLIDKSALIELLNPTNYDYAFKLCFENKPGDGFGILLASLPKFSDFWLNYVCERLKTPSRNIEHCTIELLADILKNLDKQNTIDYNINIIELLSDEFMLMFTNGLKRLKQKKDDKSRQEYNKFTEALVTACKNLKCEEITLNVIKRLILPPAGIPNIENFTSTRVIHQLIAFLNEDGVKTLYTIYERVFTGHVQASDEGTDKNTYFQKKDAGFMLQDLLSHKVVQKSVAWRIEKLEFFFKYGIFHVNDDQLICKSEFASNFSQNFGNQCKAIFYKSLQSKLNDLKAEQEILRGLFEYGSSQLEKKHYEKYLRSKQFDADALAAWQKARNKLNKTWESKKNKHKKVVSVLSILLINVSLLLFNDPLSSQEAIADLLECMERAEKKELKQEEVTECPTDVKWIEVVVDIFLQLLSKDASAIRCLVNGIFAHLCDHVSLDIIQEQVLVLLDMKKGNALEQRQTEVNECSDNESDEDEANKPGSGKRKRKASREDNDEDACEADSQSDEPDDDDDDDDDENDEDEEHLEDEDEHVSRAEELRNDISQAIMSAGIDSKYAEDECASIDLNDLDEEDGKKLDEAILNVFKAKTKLPSTEKRLKKTKNYRGFKTSVMHYRMRVLDLLDIYLQKRPHLLAAIEILLAVLSMLNHCIESELQPLKARAEKQLNRILVNKTYPLPDNEAPAALEAIEQALCDLCQSKVNYTTHVERDRCIVFIIGSSLRTGIDMKPIRVLLQERFAEFTSSRSPSLNMKLMSDIMRLSWKGLWKLAQILVDRGTTAQTRAFRRIQVYELLSVLYRNNQLHQKTGKEKLAKHFNVIEARLLEHLTEIISTNESTKRISVKEYETLLEYILHAEEARKRLSINGRSVIFSDPVFIKNLQQQGVNLNLETHQIYKRFCAALIKVPPKLNGHIAAPKAPCSSEVAAKFVDGDHDTHHMNTATSNDIKEPRTIKTKKSKRRRLNGEA